MVWFLYCHHLGFTKRPLQSYRMNVKVCSIAAVFSNAYSHSSEECCINAWNVPEYCSKVPPAEAQVLLWYAENQLHLVQ